LHCRIRDPTTLRLKQHCCWCKPGQCNTLSLTTSSGSPSPSAAHTSPCCTHVPRVTAVFWIAFAGPGRARPGRAGSLRPGRVSIHVRGLRTVNKEIMSFTLTFMIFTQALVCGTVGTHARIRLPSMNRAPSQIQPVVAVKICTRAVNGSSMPPMTLLWLQVTLL
jgi:hypothetical protein